MSNSLHPMLNVAIKAARAAGALINRAALDVESVRVAQKQVNDFVTEVDQAAERVIIETLLNAYPQHSILAEESGSEHGAKNSDHVWIIDPLDGTTNFIHGFPVYCVSIALAYKGKIEHAVVYDPSRNDLFTATKGRGAYLNERRIRVSKRTQLRDCLISTGFPFRRGDNFKQYMLMLGEVMQRTAGVRRPGSAALDLAYVAAGFADGFFESGLSIWDVAAGSLLVSEAGGLVGNFTGEADFLEQKEILAANPRIYGALIPVVGKFSKFATAGEKAAVRQATAGLGIEQIQPRRSAAEGNHALHLLSPHDTLAQPVQRHHTGALHGPGYLRLGQLYQSAGDIKARARPGSNQPGILQPVIGLHHRGLGYAVLTGDFAHRRQFFPAC